MRHFNTFLLVISSFTLLILMTSSCPHPKFVKKHVCLDCQNTVKDVTHFAYKSAAVRRHQTGQNLIFVAPSMTYMRVGKFCVFNFRVPKYNCLFRNKQWSCRFVRDVIARHDAKSGHYYYRLDT